MGFSGGGVPLSVILPVTSAAEEIWSDPASANAARSENEVFIELIFINSGAETII